MNTSPTFSPSPSSSPTSFPTDSPVLMSEDKRDLNIPEGYHMVLVRNAYRPRVRLFRLSPIPGNTVLVLEDAYMPEINVYDESD